MYRYIFLALLLVNFSACVVKTSSFSSPYALDTKQQSLDFKLLEAMTYNEMGEALKSRDMFLELFAEYKDEKLIENAFMISIFNNLDKKDELYELAKPYFNQSPDLMRLGVLYHIQKQDTKSAKNLLEELILRDKDFRNYELLGDIYAQNRQFALSLQNYYLAKKYLKEELDPNENLSLKIADNELILGQKQNAKKELESFVSKTGCSLKICSLLANLYSELGEKEKLQNLLFKLYELTQNKAYLDDSVRLLYEDKKYQEALNLTLAYNLDENFAFALFSALKKEQEAYHFALKAYKKTNNKRFLLIAATTEFELALKAKKVDEKVLESVIAKFEEGIDETSEALFLNYYGYLLIDHDKDIQKGIELVQRALKLENNNLFFIDSLAWGYYKQNQCQKAWELMLETMHDKEFIDSAESKAHIKAIQKCLQEEKK
ncbi:ATP-dependent nuclease subunit B [Campylobacter sp. MIT 12-8780]|uniref:tetratricopeptide repeat protein n=1 Tax=unclassified Campylobacter TaxID=2593542 RepID=UPI00115CE226|nr:MULTISPECIES: ATP-dependent nuclease subunit B [unclassified Campylobacter]NDJ26858.1 ATP-dependent nuclease subunit B [Campylobacter sp. MIT 19-121]TQR41996.1 ATP-dependent nuclease subunit B [Campylobacter sp. MIT 12-8780]